MTREHPEENTTSECDIPATEASQSSTDSHKFHTSSPQLQQIATNSPTQQSTSPKITYEEIIIFLNVTKQLATSIKVIRLSPEPK